jgi:hypothetical protein
MRLMEKEDRTYVVKVPGQRRRVVPAPSAGKVVPNAPKMRNRRRTHRRNSRKGERMKRSSAPAGVDDFILASAFRLLTCREGSFDSSAAAAAVIGSMISSRPRPH